MSDFREGFSAIPRHLFGTLTAYELAVLAAIHSRYPNAYPSLDLLAHDAGMSRSSAQRTLVSLQEKGLVEVESGKDKGRTNDYILSTAFFGGGRSQRPRGRSHRPTGVGHSDLRSRTTEVDQEKKNERTTSSRIEAETGPMGKSVIYDNQEMPEEGRNPKTKKEPPTPGTNPWVVYRFREIARKHGVTRFNLRHLNSLVKSLREEEGLSNEEIEIVIRVFFSRYGDTVRMKRSEIDPIRIFHQRINSGLLAQAEDLIRKHRRGDTSSVIAPEVQTILERYSSSG